VAIRSIDVSLDGRFVVVADSSGCCFVWEIQNDDLEEWQKFQAHEDYILKGLISNDIQTFATCSADRTIKLYDITEDNGFVYRKSLYGHTKWVWDCCFISDSSHLITVSTDCHLKVWDCNTGTLKKSAC
jgi:G protein beta subunit-like protein